MNEFPTSSTLIRSAPARASRHRSHPRRLQNRRRKGFRCPSRFARDLTNPSFGCLLPLEKSSEPRSAEIKQVPMPASTDRPIHAVLIPWVITLVALIGLNAIAPDYSRTRKNDSTGESGLSQPADAPPAPGHAASPLVFLVPHVTCRETILVSQVLSIEVLREAPPTASPQGAVRGRAPPAGLLA